MSPRTVWSVAVADFRDRARRPVFTVCLLVAVGVGYLAAPPAAAGYTMVKVGAFRGLYDSAYLGTMMAMVGALWLSWIGFYAVRTAVARDSTSGVGELLATTRLRTTAYLAGKFVANLMFLFAMAGALALTAPVMQLIRGESASVDLLALWAPFLLLCLPVLAVSAAAALLFETIGFLRGGLGNIAWFFGFGALFVGWFSAGLAGVTDSMRADVAAQHPGAGTEVSIGVTGEENGLGIFTWTGNHASGELFGQQAGFLLVALAVALVPALWFGRFDPSRSLHRSRAVPAPPELPAAVPAPMFARSARLTPPAVRGGGTLRLVVGETRLLLTGQPLWWWLGLAGITVVALLGAGIDARGTLLLAWIWPVLIWSRLGSFATEHDMGPLLTALPARRRRLVAEWGAGVVVTALCGLGPLIHLVLAGDVLGTGAWLGAVGFIPALAIGLGTLSRSPRPFQVVYVALWYLMVNGIAAADVMGVVRQGDQLAGPPVAAVGAAAAVALLAAAAVREARHGAR
ncbi:hypothetical protein ACFS27_24690 [Promicromonospora vindobonensis]|uniref:ABC-2 type transport system permease protein n=1 Tax=Promicromonospora vindobonensis TaxID=195748 RepID=A0ABW5W2G6_9MICO